MDKQVDESWKDAVAKEKDSGLVGADGQPLDQSSASSDATSSQSDSSSAEEAMELNFLNYITSLGFQAMIFLGEMPHPVSQQMEKNLDQAKMIIDTLVMLKEKTKGNLNEQEDNILGVSAYELQLKYVEAVGKSNENK